MDVRLPKLGEGADSGTVVSIMVKEGDTIAEGQTILELENEKAVAPIPSTVAGKVTSLRVKEGDKISVGQVILSVEQGRGGEQPTPTRAERAPGETEKEDEPEESEKSAPSSESREPSSEDSQEPVSAAAGIAPAAAPSIRRLARELGIDLTRVRGRERGGRIVLADLRAYIQRLQESAAKGKPAAARKPEIAPAERIDFARWGPVTRKPLTQLRKIIAQRMTESWTTIPHVTQFAEADITALEELRKKHAAAYEKKGVRLTLTSFIVKAVVAALKKHPMLNSSLDDAAQEVVFKDYYHLGVAVDTEQGLIVPVLRDADKKDLLQISKEINELGQKARSRKVSLEELKGGTFTISNQGGIGGGAFTPIINKPEAAILGLGRGALRVVAKEGKTEQRLILPLALSYDHRLIDGANAARFIVELVKEIEKGGEGITS